jgi:hypothetical protein
LQGIAEAAALASAALPDGLAEAVLAVARD